MAVKLPAKWKRGMIDWVCLGMKGCPQLANSLGTRYTVDASVGLGPLSRMGGRGASYVVDLLCVHSYECWGGCVCRGGGGGENRE